MRLSRRTLALPCALLLTFAGAASAQAAITITSPRERGVHERPHPRGGLHRRRGRSAPSRWKSTRSSSVIRQPTTTATAASARTLTSPRTRWTSMEGLCDRQWVQPLALRDPAGVSPNLDTVTVHIDQIPSIGISTEPHVAENVSFSRDERHPRQGHQAVHRRRLEQAPSRPTTDGNIEETSSRPGVDAGSAHRLDELGGRRRHREQPG